MTSSDIQQAVNFYILPDSDISNRHFFVCRLVEKALEQGLPTLIVAADPDHARVLDKILWTAKPESFIPHEILSQESVAATLPQVVISDSASLAARVSFIPQVVIDVSHDGTPLPYPKIMLVANQHAEILANARMKYQAYANTGVTPTVHKISKEQLALSDN